MNAPTQVFQQSPTRLDFATAQGEPLICQTPQPASDLNQQAKRIQDLLDKAEALPDPAASVLVQECLSSVLALYGEGLARLLDIARSAGGAGQQFLEQLGRDPAVRGLLLIHGLHPIDVETRLHEALDKVRPYMESHGGNVELLGLENGVARLHLKGTCQSCPSSTVTLELAVRRAIEEACPDLVGFVVE